LYSYLDKTGNDWDKRKTSHKQPGKYYPIEVDSSKKADPNASANAGEINENLPSYLDPRVRSVVELIFDTSMIKREMIALEIDIAKMPLGAHAVSCVLHSFVVLICSLGNLTQQRIKEGYSVLTEIEQVLKTKCLICFPIPPFLSLTSLPS